MVSPSYPSSSACFCFCRHVIHMHSPSQVQVPTEMAAIACGAFHNMALSRSGQVYTWGTNDYGQLGNGNTSYQIEPMHVQLPEGEMVRGGREGGCARRRMR